MQEITDEDITHAETILFGRAGVFDEERKRFIRELQTCDLQAVPGSGKTTVLLAKLLIIERYLPVQQGKGILVISHTNAAVDEIKNRIGIYCPKLFSEPNFIGTIQSFVDKYLCVPFYTYKYKRKPLRIDDEIYAEKALRFSTFRIGGFTSQEGKNAIYYLRSNENAANIRFSMIDGAIALTSSYLGNPLVINKPRTTATSFWSDAEKGRVLSWLGHFKNRLIVEGYLCFDDAYFLADKYMILFPQVIEILAERFAYVFVDEMQDMEKYQYDLLERIFFNEGRSASVYQRIGDSNQAIYSKEAHLSNFWTPRPLVRELTGSHRLTAINARVVQCLALRPIAVTGLHAIAGFPEGIKPHLIVYNDSNIGNVIERFARIINAFQTSGHIPQNAKHPFKAICWNTKIEANKTRLNNYYPHYSKETQKLKLNYSCLEDYLHLFDREAKSFGTIRKSILNGLLKILRLEEVYDSDGSYYTKQRLLSFISEINPEFYDNLQTKLFTWSKDTLLLNEASVLVEMKTYLPLFLNLFHKTISNSSSFVNGSYVPVPLVAVTTQKSNVPAYEGVNIEVGTVHAAKGQTHTGTLYLESYYQRSVGGTGNYESQRLSPQLKETSPSGTLHEYIKQSMKMAYVGFSRPTHLLCFAVHEDRFQESLVDINRTLWEVISMS